MVPFPNPDEVTMHHAASDVAVHELLVVTVKSVAPEGAGTF